MDYIDPGDFSARSSLPSASMEIIADDIRALRDATLGTAFAGVSVTASATDTPHSNWHAVSWDSASVDETGWWGSGDQIVVPASAIPSGATQVVLECDMTVRFDVNGTGVRGAEVTLNGAVVEHPFLTSALAADYTVVSLPPAWAICVAGDIIRGSVYQSSSGNLAYIAYMHIKRIGSL